MVAVLGLGLAAVSPVALALPGDSSSSEGSSTKLAEHDRAIKSQRAEINSLSDEVDELHTVTTVILAPIAVLVGILALGGSLGIVFSVRDQRRVSQIHEMTVGSEVLSQRRTEQSYASFFEQSQTTLALVNDTLELAKEATDRAAKSMEQKAKAQVNAIEERSEDLMQRVFKQADFEMLVYEPGYRGELHAIGEELRSLEGYLTLQDIKLPRHTKFVKALDQFLLDDTETALNALRRASQSDATGQLHHFILFWLGYMYTTVGDYDVAVRTFQDDEIGLKDDDTERYQLECIIAETRFFDLAKQRRAKEPGASAEEAIRETLERLQMVAFLLDELTDLALAVVTSKDQHERGHVSLEIARTRADIYVWIAYDPDRLDRPIPDQTEAIKHLPMLEDPAGVVMRAVESGIFESDSAPPEKVREKHEPGEAAVFAASPAAAELSPDALRAWALMQAKKICDVQPDPNFDVAFALAECHFMLEDDEAEGAFVDAERALSNEFGDYLEKRKKVSLRQSELICHSRLHYLRSNNEQQRQYETRHVRQSAREAREAVSEMRQARVTVFSQIQRRNVTQSEFIKEVEDIVLQEHLED